MGQCDCTGWWQQAGLGRQMMHDLQLGFYGERGERIDGSGVDIIAPFDLRGTIRPDGMVEIRKDYEYRHSVLYVGQYDGEGTLFGTWAIGDDRGEWSIRFTRPKDRSELEIQEIQPNPRQH